MNFEITELAIFSLRCISPASTLRIAVFGASFVSFLIPDFFQMDSVWEVLEYNDALAAVVAFIMNHHLLITICCLLGGVFFWKGIQKDRKISKENNWKNPFGRWIFQFFILVTIMLVAIFYHPYSKRISSIKAVLETKYNDDKFDTTGDDKEHFLAQDGRNAFNDGDYAYAILIFSQCETNANNNPKNSWQANKPLLYAAIYHQNPTQTGYMQFTNQFSGLLQEIEQQLVSKSGRFYVSGVLADTRQQIVKVKYLLSEEPQRTYLQTNVIDRIDELLLEHPEIR